MYCKPSTLKNALSNYMGYKPTASEHLRETRAFWIPIVLEDAKTASRVRHISEAILTGDFQNNIPEYQALPQDVQIAVALCTTQGWAEYLNTLPSDQRAQPGPLKMTARVGEFLAYININHATLAVRNWGYRDGGKINAMQIIQDGRVTTNKSWMSVYLNIRKNWDKRGFDWERRNREEAAA